MCQCRDVTIVNVIVAFHIPIGYLLCCRRSEKRTYVNGHVKYRKCSVTLGLILRIVIQVAYHDLQVALEQSRTEGDQE